MNAIDAALPKGPVLGWTSFRAAASAPLACVQDLPHHRLLTSGRAALYQALLQLGLPPGSGVLVPTYHCPTIVAPVLLAGLQVHYFGIGEDGLPALGGLDAQIVKTCRAIIVAHYFGLPKSLAAVRGQCSKGLQAMSARQREPAALRTGLALPSAWPKRYDIEARPHVFRQDAGRRFGSGDFRVAGQFSRRKIGGGFIDGGLRLKCKRSSRWMKSLLPGFARPLPQWQRSPFFRNSTRFSRRKCRGAAAPCAL